jgi:hypothetical protein
VSDPLDILVVHTRVQELDQVAVLTYHAQSGVLSADQLTCLLDDALQQGGEVEIAADRLRRPKQPTQPSLSPQHLGGSFDELLEQVVELQSRNGGEHHLPIWIADGALTGGRDHRSGQAIV